MNVSARIVKIAVAGVFLAFGIPGFSATPSSASKPSPKWEQYEVMLLPLPGGQLIPVVRAGNSCVNGNHYGCMRFPLLTGGNIRLFLPGQREGEILSCDEGAPAVKEVITKIELTSAEASDREGTKGNFSVDSEPWLRQAVPQLASDGTYYSADNATGLNQVYLINLNNRPEEELLQFWYRVEVTDCEDPEIKYTTDPRVDNEGFPPP